MLESVYVVEPSVVNGQARFGAWVTVEDENGAQQISSASPVAQALLGKRAGDRVVLRRPKGDVAVTVV